MRPVRLELKGFTSFRDEQAVDFGELDLFAVSGQTGSGKSSLLDAMTYALFGYVERVGKQVGQLVSQGQPRMAVKLEFRVGEERFRVARSTPSARGATKIRLERWDGEGWRQAGEGADRVRDADAMIQSILGLDYDTFTRSVLLPQGKFAEFLVGEAKDRRKILTELLGLDLFERLAKRAGELRRDASAEADMKARLLETEYAGVTPEAVTEAELLAKEATTRDEALASAEAAVKAIADRWSETARTIRELQLCVSDARGSAGVARAAARSLEDLGATLADTEARVRQLAKATIAAGKVADKAERALMTAEAEWGRAKDLTALRVRAESLAGARDEIAETDAELKELGRERPKLEKTLSTAEQLLATRVGNAETAILALRSAKEALDEATHADLVAAIRAGMHSGDACPVCGAHVEKLPKAPRAPSLERARAALDAAERRAAEANETLREAERARDQAAAALEAAAREAERLERESAKRRRELAALEAELASAMGGKLPADPVAALDERLDRLEKLEDAVRSAIEAVTGIKEAASGAEREREALAAEAGKERVRLEGLAVRGLLERARTLAGSDLGLPDLPAAAAAKDVPSLGVAAAGLADGLASLADGLEEMAASKAEGERDLLVEAARRVEGLVESEGSLADLQDVVAGERRRAAAASLGAEKDASALRTKLENAQALVEQIAAARERSERYGALAAELRADRIIAFLQLEALRVLAAAGAVRLSTLSGGRYRLRYDEDEFYVVDTWNGEETRSARTLSGGETFLASLALALALSEQVQSLAVTERARMESLFLDEGFGTLDPETLEIVVEAIEQLGGDGRMVGVITHVQELAIRLPARIEVEKSPRGSSLRVVS